MARSRLAVAFLFAACDGAEPDARADESVEVPSDAQVDFGLPIPDAESWLRIGQGETTFQNLSQNGEVDVRIGPQGAWMTFLALQGAGFIPERARIHFRAYLGGEQVANLNHQADFALEDGLLQAAGLALVFDPDADMATMLGQSVTVEADLVDSAGARAQGQATIRPSM